MLSVPRCLTGSVCCTLVLTVALAQATPIRPLSDDDVVETLPALGAFAKEQRQLRRQLARAPRDAVAALALSNSLLARARRDGDARLAGQGLGALRAWDGDAQAPLEIRLQRATLLQYLHRFDEAVAELEALLKQDPRHAQALLTLATVRRVQARYDASDEACRRLQSAGQPLYAAACLAENQGLRGQVDAARRALQDLIAARAADAGWGAWLRTTLGELEARAGRPDAAIAQWQAALKLDDDDYTRLDLADALLDARRWAEAEALLSASGDSDPVLLRRVIAAHGAGRPEAAALQRSLAQRYAQAALRPEAAAVHGRERARFALEVEGDAPQALALARRNLQAQREAIDFVVMARAARAAGDAAAQAEVQALARAAGLHDVRLDGATVATAR